MQRVRACFAAAALASGLIAHPAAAQTTLRLGYALAPTSHYGVGAAAFAAEVAKRSGGRLRIQEYPASALGGEREMIEAAQLGTLDLVITSTGPLGNFVPATLITDIPFLFRDYGHAHRVLDGPIGREILDQCGPKGLVCLAWWENGFRHLTNNKRPVHEPGDVRGLKVRTMENSVHMTAFRTLGAAPTPMAFPEVFGALQQGVIDGQENPMSVILTANLGQVQKYLSLTGHVYSPALLIASGATWAKLSLEDRAILQAAARIGANANRRKVATDEAVGVEALQRAGMQVVTQVDKARFRAALGPAYREYAQRFGQANIDRIVNTR